jgi:hypothetical protein
MKSMKQCQMWKNSQGFGVDQSEERLGFSKYRKYRKIRTVGDLGFVLHVLRVRQSLLPIPHDVLPSSSESIILPMR